MEENKTKSKMDLVKIFVIAVCVCLLFSTSILVLFASLLNGGIQDWIVYVINWLCVKSPCCVKSQHPV